MNNNSPCKDNSGRDLYRVELTDGMNFKTINIFAYSAEGAIEKAEGAHPYFRWLRCKKCDQNGR